jgi:hypothetical protein
LTFRFVDDKLEYTRHNNVGFGPQGDLDRPTLVGTRA